MVMKPLEALTLEAFQLALQTLPAPLPADIEHRIEAELTRLQTNGQTDDGLDGLLAIVESYPPLAAAYQTHRIHLQSQEGQRQKRLVSQAQALLPPPAPPTPVTVPASPFSASPPPRVPASPPSPLPPSPSPLIQRFVLPANATPSQHQAFDHYITDLKRLNPHWAVTPDRPQVSEADAYVMIYNDADYSIRYAAYLAARALNQVF